MSKASSQLLWFCIAFAIGFCFATLYDWVKKIAPLLQPIKSKAKNNRDLLARVFDFSHSAAATSILPRVRLL